jgi:hypothetical protein
MERSSAGPWSIVSTAAAMIASLLVLDGRGIELTVSGWRRAQLASVISEGGLQAGRLRVK